MHDSVADREPFVAPQFDDLEQQHHASELGMWVFLATEVMFFGGLFLAYMIYRLVYEPGFALASHRLNLPLATVNTAVLLTSSLTMALAVRSAALGHRGALCRLLIATIVLGAAFLGIKFYEYYSEAREGLIPLFGWEFRWEEAGSAQAAALFFNLYFLMTGLHAVHMIIGLAILLILTWLAARGGLLGGRSMPVHAVGLYWHFVDVVWVFLYPLLYLIGGRG